MYMSLYTYYKLFRPPGRREGRLAIYLCEDRLELIPILLPGPNSGVCLRAGNLFERRIGYPPTFVLFCRLGTGLPCQCDKRGGGPVSPKLEGDTLRYTYKYTAHRRSLVFTKAGPFIPLQTHLVSKPINVERRSSTTCIFLVPLSSSSLRVPSCHPTPIQCPHSKARSSGETPLPGMSTLLSLISSLSLNSRSLRCTGTVVLAPQYLCAQVTPVFLYGFTTKNNGRCRWPSPKSEPKSDSRAVVDCWVDGDPGLRALQRLMSPKRQ